MKHPPLWALTVAAVPLAGMVGYGLWKQADDPVVKDETEQGVREVEHEQLIEDDEADAVSCRQSSECHPDIVYAPTGDHMIRRGRYCYKPAGDCDGMGRCEWNPEMVLQHQHPVCGCDGKTYANWTYAAARGINIAHDGHCPGAPLDRPPPREFDSRWVLGPLNEAARTAGEKCNRPKDHAVRGRAIITFEPSGRISSVDVQGELSGTPVGDCVRRHFQTVVTPPFNGKPVSVGKAFFFEPAVQ